MERQKPDTGSNEIELYIRTYYSLLRSTGEVRVRSIEETHSFSNSSLHLGAREAQPDISAFAYAAGRLPECMPQIERIVLGQSDQTFEAHGYAASGWLRVNTRGRRRMIRWDGEHTLAVYVASTSDIDDLVPIVTAYQIEWNKMWAMLRASEADGSLEERLGVTAEDVKRLREALGEAADEALEAMDHQALDLRLHLPAGSFSEYQKAAQIWWRGIERCYIPPRGRRPPVYFVSSNTHALANLIGGYATAHADQLREAAAGKGFNNGIQDDLELDAAEPAGANALYYALRTHLKREPESLAHILKWDHANGIQLVENRAHVDVDSQIIKLSQLRLESLDPRLHMPGLETLADSDACIINIDYPLGMAAYHLLSRLGHGIGPLLGVYVMGKGATLNAQVGDVMLSRVVHDEHSSNTYLFHNAFRASDVLPFLTHGSVLDNQKAVTVRSAFLQNTSYMGVFYREGYTVLEMEAGPYMSAIFEHVDPRRHPNDQLVNLADRTTFDVGLLHYASDTPYSRRQELLSKSLGAFGMDATYACAIAIARRIFSQELQRVTSGRPSSSTL